MLPAGDKMVSLNWKVSLSPGPFDFSRRKGDSMLAEVIDANSQ